MFNALRHNVRRKILVRLSKEKLSFTGLLEELGISSSHLTYHLDCLGELISKEDSKYRLAPFGEAAIKTMSNVEKLRPSHSRVSFNYIFKVFQITALILIFVLSSQNITLAENLQNRALILGEKEAEIQALSYEVFVYHGLSELMYYTQRRPDTKVASHVILSNVENHVSELNLSLYTPLDNATLQIDLMHNIPDGVTVLLVIRRQFMNVDDDILKIVQVTAEDRHFEVELESKGWYLLTLHSSTMVEESEIHNVLRVWSFCQVTYDTKSILFGYLPNSSIISDVIS